MTVQQRLDAVQEALARHGPRDDPGPLTTTVVETVQMLQRAERTGTVLPDGGRFLAVYPGPGGAERLCSLHLPDGFRRGAKPPETVLLLAELPGSEAALAATTGAILRDLAADTRVVAVPHLPAAGRPATSLAEAQAARDWLTDFLGAARPRLAGVDAGAGTALRLSLAEPDRCVDVLLLAGLGFAPWPEADAPTLSSRLPGPGNGVAYTWILFPAETARGGQADAVLEAMRSAGYAIAGVTPVRGGFSLSQAAGRVARWVADAEP
jgi:pimeloyl-ACP methyl ester carboxylesterase